MGSTAGSAAYGHGGWYAACTAAACFCGLGFVAWLAAGRAENGTPGTR